MSDPRRRALIGGLAAATTGAGILGTLGADSTPQSTVAAPNIARNLKRFRLATSWPKDFPGLGMMPVRFADALRRMSAGRLDVKVFAAGELVDAAACFDAASTGAADMYHAAEYYWQGKSAAFNFFTAVPMGLTAPEIMGWIDFGGGQDLWDELSARFNIKALMCGNSGHQTGGWYKREINSLEDFKGLRIRMPGLGGEVVRRMGGAAVKLSGGEIYQALQSGAIDATEWVGPWNDLAFGFYREAPYYYAPGFHEPGSVLSLGINLDVWNGLTPGDQAMVKAAARHANDVSMGEFVHENGRALDVLRIDHGVAPRFFADDIIVTAARISQDVVAELAGADDLTARTFESYNAARNSYRRWTEMGDGRFIAARKAAMDS